MLLSIPPLRVAMSAETSAFILQEGENCKIINGICISFTFWGTNRYVGSNTVTKVLSELREKVVKSCRLPYCSNS